MIDLRCGRAEDILRTLPDACCDALVSDPPAGVSFMGKDWDGHKGGRDQWIAWLAGILAEARRVLKPGGYALVWALPRTSHWTATALDDGGWRIIDIITHHFGQGFPKGKGQLKPASEHWILCRAPGPLQPLQIDAARVPTGGETTSRTVNVRGVLHYAGQNHRPHHDLPEQPRETGGADGGRWPPNALFSHVGGPDGCQPAGVRRVPADTRGQGRPRGTFPHSDDAWGNGHRAYTGAETAGEGTEVQQEYLCVDGCPIKALDEQAGPRTTGAKAMHPVRTTTKGRTTWGSGQGGGILHSPPEEYPASTGNCSRFFPTFGPDPEDAVPFRYVPKASRAERNAGLDGMPVEAAGAYGAFRGGEVGAYPDRGNRQAEHRPAANGHPTVKPLGLMSWLVRLIAGPGAVVLDPFCGSGSTGVACVREGFGFIGIEQELSYVDIARARIAHAQEQHSGPLFAGVGTATAAAR